MSLNANVGTLRFFRHHPWLLSHGSVRNRRVARAAVRRAHIWIPIIRRELAQTRAWLHPEPVIPTDPAAVVRYVFGRYGDQALRVSRDCEARAAWANGDPTTARNGQYLGPFQMGSAERATYGDGRTMLAMTQAAWRYFVASGSDWSPWSCKP